MLAPGRIGDRPGAWLCYGLSYRDVEELLAERGIEVDELLPEAMHDADQYSNNRIENDSGRLAPRPTKFGSQLSSQTCL